MKDEQQLHGASPELSLCHIAVKSDCGKKKKKKETLSGKSMFPGRRQHSRTSEGDKSVKPDICARTSANNDSCASNIDSKIEQRFKRKFAYLI